MSRCGAIFLLSQTHSTFPRNVLTIVNAADGAWPGEEKQQVAVAAVAEEPGRVLAHLRSGDPVPAGLCGGERGARHGAARGDMPIAHSRLNDLAGPGRHDNPVGLDCSISPRDAKLEISAGDLPSGLLRSRSREAWDWHRYRRLPGVAALKVMVRACNPAAVSLPREP